MSDGYAAGQYDADVTIATELVRQRHRKLMVALWPRKATPDTAAWLVAMSTSLGQAASTARTFDAAGERPVAAPSHPPDPVTRTARMRLSDDLLAVAALAVGAAATTLYEWSPDVKATVEECADVVVDSVAGCLFPVPRQRRPDISAASWIEELILDHGEAMRVAHISAGGPGSTRLVWELLSRGDGPMWGTRETTLFGPAVTAVLALLALHPDGLSRRDWEIEDDDRACDE